MFTVESDDVTQTFELMKQTESSSSGVCISLSPSLSRTHRFLLIPTKVHSAHTQTLIYFHCVGAQYFLLKMEVKALF